jgi:hypothetical protein
MKGVTLSSFQTLADQCTEPQKYMYIIAEGSVYREKTAEDSSVHHIDTRVFFTIKLYGLIFRWEDILLARSIF